MPTKKRRSFDRTCKTEHRVKRGSPRCPGCKTPMLADPKHPNPHAKWECVFCNRYFTDAILSAQGGDK